MMSKILKFLGWGILSLLLLLILFTGVKLYLWNQTSTQNLAQLGAEAPVLTIEQFTFRDLNKNGKLDLYEDSRQPVEIRVENLIQQMTIEEKAGSMFISMAGVSSDGKLMERPEFTNFFSFLFPSNSTLVVEKKINHLNIIDAYPPNKMIQWYNTLQKTAEKTRLGIPITLATDPRHGVSKTFGASIYTPYFSKWPSALGMAATRDIALVESFGSIVQKEYKALGIQMALGPMADVATEPRWMRINGTFGEDATLNSSLTAAYIRGLQGNHIDKNAVAAMVKHFPGSGPLDDGKDSHFPPGLQSYPGNNFNYHLKPFEAAFNENVAAVMLYYSVPKDKTSENVAAAYNKDITTHLLREKYNFQGIICTDWGIVSDITLFGQLFKPASAHGVEHLSVDQRLVKIFDAGVDLIGGETLSAELASLIRSGAIKEERIDQSLKRIFRLKFKLGLFDNPYLKVDKKEIFNNPVFIEKGIEAQKKSLVLLKNENALLPLPPGINFYLHGFDEEFVQSTSAVTLDKADVIIAKVKSPQREIESEYMMEKLFGGGALDYTPEELDQMLSLFAKKPTVVVLNVQRPAVIPEIANSVQGLIADFDVANDLILDLIFGVFSPSGKLPFDMPRSMQEVEKQLEDVPFDTANPVFQFGDGMSY